MEPTADVFVELLSFQYLAENQGHSWEWPHSANGRLAILILALLPGSIWPFSCSSILHVSLPYQAYSASFQIACSSSLALRLFCLLGVCINYHLNQCMFWVVIALQSWKWSIFISVMAFQLSEVDYNKCFKAMFLHLWENLMQQL